MERGRYFFKEDITMDEIKYAKNLVNFIFDEGFETYSKMKVAEKELTRLLDMCGKDHGKKKKIKETGRPYDNPLINKMGTADSGSREAKSANSEIGDAPDTGPEEEDTDYQAKEENPKKQTNDINHVPKQNAAALLKSVHDELEEMLMYLKENKEAYQKFFKGMLAKHGIKSLKDVPPEKKKEFFNAVDKSWKAKNETD